MNPFLPSIKKIGLFELSSIPDQERSERGLAMLRTWGINCVRPVPRFPPLRFLAAPDEERLRLFGELLADDSIDVLMAMRGGYGITRILDDIDWSALRRRNLPVIGYSDVSALHLAALQHGCRNHIHGPMLCSELGRKLDGRGDEQALDIALRSLACCLDGAPCPIPPECRSLKTLQAGTATGQLVPCNLTLLCSLIGTGHLPELKGAILAVEDVNEAAHRIDRMLTHLKSAGILKKLGALIFGQFTEAEDAQYIRGILADFAEQVPGPVVTGLPFGHGFPSMSMRVGAEVTLEATTPEVVTITRAPMDAYESRMLDTSCGIMGFRLLRPEHIEPGRRYPVILLLHGAGERGEDNRAQLVHLASTFVKPGIRRDFPCFVVVPQCPEQQMWVNTPWSLPRHDMPEQISPPLASALEILGWLEQNLPIDTARRYLVGLSMGGYGVWDTLQRYPGRFAAAVPICGGGDTALAPRLKEVPIWAFHGGKDTTVPTIRSVNMAQAVNDAGGNVRLTVFPEAAHDSWNPAFGTPELFPWLFAQRR